MQQAAIATECGVGTSTSSPPQQSKRQAGDDDDDDDIPTLPAVISNIARALRGGPFDDGKRCNDYTIVIL